MKASKTYLALILASASVGAFYLPGCETAPPTQEARDSLWDNGNASMAEMKRTDPWLDNFMKDTAGYAIFPDIGKGGVGVGGAYGRGLVFSHGKLIGYAEMSQGTVGVELGGQTYSELIVFQNDGALNRLENNNVSFDASASAVALSAGAAKTAQFTNGVAVFTHPTGGLMFEAAIGGQQFTYRADSK
jgi:lipid-binding SYLF domain-containing protein